MSTIGFYFNSVELPHIRGYSENVNSIVDSLVRIGRDGAESNTGKIGARAINIRGQISGADHDAVRTAWAAVLAALYDDDGGNTKAYLRSFSDRQITAQVINHAYSYNQRDAGMQTADYSISFRSDDAYWERVMNVNKSGASLSSGDKVTITYGNDDDEVEDAPSWPRITVTAITQLDADIVLTNNTTGAIWTYGANLAAGHILIVDMEEHTVTDDMTSVMNNTDHPDADWWMLRGGVANEIQLDFGGGANDAAMSITFAGRNFNP